MDITEKRPKASKLQNLKRAWKRVYLVFNPVNATVDLGFS